MPLIRKACGGATVLGYTWAADGAVVDVADEHAAMLLSIPDGGYSVVEQSATFSEVVNDTPTVNRPVQRSRPTSRNRE